MHLPTDPSFPNDRPVLEVDLRAIVANRRLLMELAPRAEVAAVLKADAYGLGATQVGRALADDGCRTFFVATTDEALALRKVLPNPRIFVLGGPARGAEQDLVEARILPALNDPSQVARWRQTAARLARPLAAAIQLDTGMCRLGVDAKDVGELDLRGIELVLVLSHLGVADLPDHPLNERQLRAFELHRASLPVAAASLAASSGILLGDSYQFDLVRPGIALYGCQPVPVPASPIALRPVVRLIVPVLQVHDVEEAGTVGYGATHPVGPGMRIATLPIGYADGLLRAAGGRTSVSIAGVSVPLVGRISMDLVTVDVTELGGRVRPGTPVEVLAGPGAVDRYADAAGTISYEVLVRLGSRIERRYLGEGA
ncbi:MAG TPA: alanine racemase [Geminicoccus sp.]|jgi:alanine racemase|uniref:alanine racemase n=1 Tax=Geminicoccus sp. TaxID=2024832 RepID=UPI002E382267|nr:alanine racemase [Geminicoccus sp.]HEX2529490.1 alanine racemase [Geminicoccus sp.]